MTDETKIEEIKKFMTTINIGKEKIMKEVVKDFADIITKKLDSKGWQETYQFVLDKRSEYNNADSSPLGRRMKHLYLATYQKMWKLNKTK